MAGKLKDGNILDPEPILVNSITDLRISPISFKTLENDSSVTLCNSLNVVRKHYLSDANIQMLLRDVLPCDGSDIYKLVEFLQQVDESIEGFEIYFDRFKLCLRILVKGRFRSWWIQNCYSDHDWKELKAKVVNTFLLPAELDILKEKYIYRWQNIGESLSTFMWDVLRKHNALGLNIPEIELVASIVSHTNPTCSMYLAQASIPESISELHAIAHRVDNAVVKISAYPASADAIKIESVQSDHRHKSGGSIFKERRNCYTCGKFGHIARNCDTVMKSSKNFKIGKNKVE